MAAVLDAPGTFLQPIPSDSKSDGSDSAGVEFRRLSINDSDPLAACKLSMRALEAFCLRPIAGDENDKEIFTVISK